MKYSLWFQVDSHDGQEPWWDKWADYNSFVDVEKDYQQWVAGQVRPECAAARIEVSR